LKALELAPFAAKLFAAAIEDGRHQRLFDELLVGLHRLLSDETVLKTIREKVRHELPTIFKLFRADAYLVRRFVALISQAIDEAKDDPKHAFRGDFDRFAREFVNKLAYKGRQERAGARGIPCSVGKPADPIVVHPDVRRMLLEIRVFNEAARALMIWAALSLAWRRVLRCSFQRPAAQARP
jgi:hypothetical protein